MNTSTQVAFGDYLQTHAYKYVWCTPDQDKQMIFKLPRISPGGGVWTEFPHMWRRFAPPTTKGIFHLYQIGGIHPTLLGLKDIVNTWVQVPRAMVDEKVMIDIYTGNGVQVPRCMCWIMVTRDDNVIVAVEKPIDKTIKLNQNLEVDALYMRLYSNAFYQTIRGTGDEFPIRVGSTRVRTSQDISDLQADMMTLPTDRGAVICYVNGHKVDTISRVNTVRGDYVDYIYDASIKRIVRLEVDDMPEFNSKLDLKRKILAHYPGNVDIIEYQDDVDVFLMKKKNNASDRCEGIYLHKNDRASLRMVTHRDYSVALTTVHGAASANPHIGMGYGLKLDFYIRHSGYDRPLVYENSRIQELYKLKEELIVRAMTGIDSTVSEWRAEELEDNNYTKVMRAPLRGISTEMVQEAYGYNSLSKLLGETPSIVRVVSGQRIIDIPEALRGRATVYEYDKFGLLIGYSYATIDETHGVSAECEFAEVYYGEGGTSLDIIQGTNQGVVDPTHNYRFYSCIIKNGTPNQEWVDKTGSNEYVTTRTTFAWTNMPDYYRLVLSNKKHLAYGFNLTPIDGVYEFDLVYESTPGTFVPIKLILGSLDLFLNGYSLIEGIDFFVKGTRIVITNKEFMINNGLGAQAIFVRYGGFAKSDMIRHPPEDRGYVHHGVLSANNKFDLRDDRVMRFIVRGQVRLRRELKFAEDGIEVSIDNALNGAPYAIRDVIVPMNNYLVKPSDNTLDDSTYEMKAKSEVIDKKVSDYMTLFKPQDVVTEPNVHQNRLLTYSPFLARILSDLNSGLLWDDIFELPFTDNELEVVLKPYEYLLEYDQIGRGNGWDNRYVVVHPHTRMTYVDVSMYTFRVMDRASKFYAQGMVDMSNHLRVVELPPVP